MECHHASDEINCNILTEEEDDDDDDDDGMWRVREESK